MYNYKVSVIIPVYNAGKRIKNCVDSLLNQTLKDIELIFILDKPTDGSDKIIKRYSNLSNVKIIENEENLNIGYSRNRGLDIAEGKYIGFCDHDDICAETMFEELYQAMEVNQADIAYSPFVTKDTKGRILSYMDYIEHPICSPENLFKISIGLSSEDPQELKCLYLPKTIWNKLYKNDVIKSNNIRFVDTRLVTPEDTIFNIEYCKHVEKQCFCHNDLYYHIYWDNNTGDSSGYKSLIKYNLGYDYIYKLLRGCDDEKKQYIFRLYNCIRINNLFIVINNP